MQGELKPPTDRRTNPLQALYASMRFGDQPERRSEARRLEDRNPQLFDRARLARLNPAATYRQEAN